MVKKVNLIVDFRFQSMYNLIKKSGCRNMLTI